MDRSRPSPTVTTGWPSVDGALFGSSGGVTGASALSFGAGDDDEPSRPVKKSGPSSSAPQSPGCVAQRAPYSSGEPGLVRGALHEWFGVGDAESVPSANPGHPGVGWSPPLFLLTHLAQRAVADALRRGAPDHVVWIGKSVWPYPRTLSCSVDVVTAAEGHSKAPHGQLRTSLTLGSEPSSMDPWKERPDLTNRSLYVAPTTQPGAKETSERLWAIDTALRCSGVTVVVADGSGLTMPATRRLQLAAASTGALVLLARPPAEIREISAATTRWAITRAGVSEGEPPPAEPRWNLTLVRAKGAQRVIAAPAVETQPDSREVMGRRRNLPSIHRYVHSHAARPSTPPSFILDRPFTTAAATSRTATDGGREDLLPTDDPHPRRTDLDRRTVQ